MASINPSSPNSSAMPRGVWSRNCNPSSLDVSCGRNSPRESCHMSGVCNPYQVPENDGRTNDDMDVSKSSGTPKSSILVMFSIINHPFWGTPIFGDTHMRNTYSIKFVLWWLKGFSPTHSTESIMIPFILLDMPSSKFAEGWGGLEAWGGPVLKNTSQNPNIHRKHQGILYRNPAKMQGSKKYDHFLLGPWSSPTTCNRAERNRRAAPKSQHSSHIHWCF